MLIWRCRRNRYHLPPDGRQHTNRLSTNRPAEIPFTAANIAPDISADVVARILLPRQDPIEPGFLPEHLLQVFPAVLEEARPRKPTMQVEPPADLPELVSDEILHPTVYLALNPANHPLEKVVYEISARLRLLNRTPPHPRKVRRTKCQRQEP